MFEPDRTLPCTPSWRSWRRMAGGSNAATRLACSAIENVKG
jgi:hypothetical protein